MTENLHQSVLAGFLEDKDVILAQQRILDLDPEVPMLAMRMDTALASFRALMEKAIAEERVQAAGGEGSEHGWPAGSDGGRLAAGSIDKDLLQGE